MASQSRLMIRDRRLAAASMWGELVVFSKFQESCWIMHRSLLTSDSSRAGSDIGGTG